MPRDRQGHYRSELLPFRKRRTVELEELAAEMFLGGLSTRDVSRVLERHFGERFDSKEISRMVAATSAELHAWRQRDLRGIKYRFLFRDGANFKVRRGKQVEQLPFLCVVGARADDGRIGGSLKRFTLPGKLSETGTLNAGRLFSDTDLQNAHVIT